MRIDSAVNSLLEGVDRHLERFAERPCFLGGWALIACLLLGFGLVPVSSASREVLSDMDCVVEPSLLVELGSAIPGLLASVPHDRSDRVKAGEVIARLESGVEELALAVAQARAGNTSAVQLRKLAASLGARTLARNRSLADSESISKQNLDQLVTESEIATLQVQRELEEQRLAALEVQRAEALVRRRELRSPIDGTITQRYKAVGEFVDSEAVYQIAQLDPLHVEVIVPIEYRNSIKDGYTAGVTLAVPGFEQRVLEATVERIDAVADAPSATYGVRLRLDNPELTIPSGVRCQVDFYAN